MTLYAVYLCPCSSRTLSRRRSLVAVMVQHPSADMARNAHYPTPRSVTRFSLPSPLEHSIIATTRTVCTCSCVLESQWPLLLFCCRHRQRHRRAGGHASAQVLSEVEAVAVWKKLILQHDKAPVVANVMEYLTDRVDGRPRRPSRQSGQSVTIQLQWATMPEWLPSVTVNQQVNHITHVNGSCRGDPATDPVSLPLITRENHQ